MLVHERLRQKEVMHPFGKNAKGFRETPSNLSEWSDSECKSYTSLINQAMELAYNIHLALG